MTPSGLLLWGLILVGQNASFTWVSRARNSGSDWYHAAAACFSNGVWFAAFYFTWGYLDLVHEQPGNMALVIPLALVYIASTVLGSVASGAFLRRFVERGKRRVGHYGDVPKPRKAPGLYRVDGKQLDQLERNEQRMNHLERRVDALTMGGEQDGISV